jgi:hypothetical protein
MSSDGILLHVSKERLERESEVFRDMLSVANPNTTDGTEEDPIKVEEKETVFLTLLSHIYPDCPRSNYPSGRDFPSIHDQFSAIRSSIKYLMPRVTTSLANELKSEYWLKNFPGQIYAFACAQDDFPDLIEAASRETLRCGILQVDMGPEGELITGQQYQDLVELHRKRGSKAIEIINHLRPFNENPHKGPGIIKCSCNKDTSGAPLWHTHFCRYAKMELSRAPLSDHIFSGAGVLEVLKDIPCRDCAKSMHEHWYLIKRAKGAIDKLPSSIKKEAKAAADI